MANLQYATDIKNYVLDRGDERTDGTSEFDTQVEEFINRQYQAIWMGGRELNPRVQEDWWWLRKDPPGAFVTNLAQTGSASVTFEDASVVLDAGQSISIAGRLFHVVGDSEYYRIASNTAMSPNIELDVVYLGTAAAAASFEVLQVEYALASDIFRLISPMRITVQNTNDDPYKIYGISLDQLEQEYPLGHLMFGPPELFAVVSQTNTEWNVRFNRYTGVANTDSIRIEYDYLYRPVALTLFGAGDTQAPAVPLEWRSILADAALFLLFLQKNDDRADTFGLSARNGLEAMARENQRKRTIMTPDFGAIIPRGNQRLHGRILRTTSGLIIG